MNTIHAFGDSYTEGQPYHCTYPPFIQWKELRGGNLPMGWVEILGEKLNMETINHGVGGNSNIQIFQDICENAHLFKKGDIVFVNWTYRDRFRWASIIKYSDGSYAHQDKDGNPLYSWRKLSSNNDNPSDFEHISRSTKDELVFNRSTNLYIDEVYNYENLIEQYANAKGFEVYFWSTDNDIIYSLPLEKYHQKKYILHNIITPRQYKKNYHGGDFMSMIMFKGGETIYMETNHMVNDDTHLGEKGHKVQAELFYEYIMSYKTNSL